MARPVAIRLSELRLVPEALELPHVEHHGPHVAERRQKRLPQGRQGLRISLCVPPCLRRASEMQGLRGHAREARV